VKVAAEAVAVEIVAVVVADRLVVVVAVRWWRIRSSPPEDAFYDDGPAARRATRSVLGCDQLSAISRTKT